MFHHFNINPSQYNFPLASLPLNLVCHESGYIAFVKTQRSSTIYERLDNGSYAIVEEDSLKFISSNVDENHEIVYNTLIDFRNKPVLIKWLQKFELELPVFN